MSAFQRWKSRPLTMNVWVNALIYGFLGVALNNLINRFWVTPQNPEGLTGFPGYLVLFLSVGLVTWTSNRENDWVKEIQKAERTAQKR